MRLFRTIAGLLAASALLAVASVPVTTVGGDMTASAAAMRSGQPAGVAKAQRKARLIRHRHRMQRRRALRRWRIASRRRAQTSQRLARKRLENRRRTGIGKATAVGSVRKKRTPTAESPASQSTTTTTTAATSDLFFDGSEIADFALLQAAPGAITEVSDPLGSGEQGFKLTVDESDVYPVTPTENPRAQALSPSIIDPGSEIWLKTKFMLPSDFPAVPGWMSLVSIYGPPFDGSSPWRIGIDGNELRWQRNGTYGYDIPWRMPIVRGRWISVLLHERFAADGWVEMWIDGERITFPNGTQRLQMQTVDSSNDGGANHAKIMNYREAGMFDSSTVYFGSLKLGKTRASVEG